MTDEQAGRTPADHDRVPNELVEQKEVFQLQVRDEEGQPWIDFGTPLADRDRMTTIQAFRITAYPTEKQRVVCHVVQTVVDEVIGDGPGETCVADLMARNEQVTAILKAQEAKTQQPPV